MGLWECYGGLICLLLFIFKYFRNEEQLKTISYKKSDRLCKGKENYKESFDEKYVRNEEQLKTISYKKSDRLCKGKEIYKGSFDGRPCAVKKILYEYNECKKKTLEEKLSYTEQMSKETNLKRELSLHQETLESGHDNVVKYFFHETIINQISYGDQVVRTYIALELCDGDLSNIDLSSELCTDICAQIAKGLGHLHTYLGAVHRDIKPANVLIKTDKRTNKKVVKLADFGISKLVSADAASTLSQVCGSPGWQAPEIQTAVQAIDFAKLEEESKVDLKKSDIYSLGLVFRYTVPKSILKPESSTHAFIVALIRHATEVDPQARPSVDEVLKHPAFYNDEMVLDFFSKVCGFLRKNPKLAVPELETPTPPVFSNDWTNALTTQVIDHLFYNKPRNDTSRYDKRKIQSLLRAIRNNNNHYHDNHADMMRLFGIHPSEFLEYWTSKFPRLLIHTYECMKAFKEDPALEKFYK